MSAAMLVPRIGEAMQSMWGIAPPTTRRLLQIMRHCKIIAMCSAFEVALHSPYAQVTNLDKGAPWTPLMLCVIKASAHYNWQHFPLAYRFITEQDFPPMVHLVGTRTFILIP